MVAVQIIRDITVTSRPRFESFELRFWLTHITIEIIEIPERLGSVSRVCICGVEAFMVLDEDRHCVYGIQ